ncbi:DUF3043 domain-containing protein [Protofrankia symbiont of Coriaria ruscifolia]|uniref:DUF3043 domain-containing protein n=1 Tax=Protofrankia symbiont of Coriaria ruscifolia TaxID=1306542 RepID=UPI0010416CBB|nr:DUF3043 domain-containing protein [Protofrankia symbiont of Coriaria ruscifolia]
MALLKRHTPARNDPADAPVVPAGPAPAADRRNGSGTPTGSENGSGKGRPTPKRSEARAARARGGSAVTTPASRKEARARSREERRRTTREYRTAMLSGDVNKLPPRERAPERVLARDFVDTRRNVGPFFLAAAALYFVGGIVPNTYVRLITTCLMLLGILAVVADSLVLVRRVGRRVTERYPDSHVKVRAYSVQRALLPARWRMPRPRVTRAGQDR